MMFPKTPPTTEPQIERNPELRTPTMLDLFTAIGLLKTPYEAKQFLRDLCTIGELKEMATRWQIALLLKEGYSYLTIAKKTGASTATVTRVASWIHHGMGGYKLMLNRIGKSMKEAANFHRLRAISKKS